MKDEHMSDDQAQNSEHFPKTQDELNRIIQNALAPKLQRISALETENAQLVKDRDAAQQKVSEQGETITGLENTVSARDRTILVNEVAHEKRVPAKYLSGDSKEELEAAADDFLNDVRSLSGSASQENSSAASAGGEPVGEQPSGYVPSAGTGGEKPPRPTYDELKQKAYEEAKTR